MTPAQLHPATTRRFARVGLLVLASILIAAGCGGDGGSAGPYAGGKKTAGSVKEQKEQYARNLTAALDAMEDTGSPPTQESVNRADRKALQEQAIRWEQSTKIIEGLEPPDDARAAHDRLVTSMRSLGGWNQRLVKAAPRVGATKAAYSRALKSPAAAQYGQSLEELGRLGYLPGQEPLEDAGSPVE